MKKERFHAHNCIMYMKQPLENLSVIFNGYSFRQPGMITSKGSIAVLQMKDVSETSLSIHQVQGFTTLNKIDERHFLQPGDILMLSKGQRTLAIRFDTMYPKAVASAAFFVIRPNPTLVDSDYLHWYLNQSKAQSWFEMGKERSATIMAVPLSVLQTLPVPLPPLKQQQMMGSLARLTAREHDLTIQIAQKRQTKRDCELEYLIDQSNTTNLSS